MGLFRVPARLTGPAGRSATAELLMDTGATLLVLPRGLAEELELAAVREQAVQIAGGRREIWPVAEARVAVEGREVTTPCFIAPSGPGLLGAVALESLFLAVDPVAKRLVPVDGFIGEVAVFRLRHARAVPRDSHVISRTSRCHALPSCPAR